jgi:hypothetical protein
MNEKSTMSAQLLVPNPVAFPGNGTRFPDTQGNSTGFLI